MKRYLVFKGAVYYPCGGMEDFVADFDFLIDAKQSLGDVTDYEWGHIYDVLRKQIVYNPDDHKLARSQGIDAYTRGKTSLECPYEKGSVGYDSWQEGFYCAREFGVKE